MKKYTFTLIFILLVSLSVKAQRPAQQGSFSNVNLPVQPFLFSVNTLTGSDPYWNLNVSSNYAERTTGAFGYDGADQQLAVKGYLGNRLTLYANADFGVSGNGSVASAQQAEVIRDFVGGKKAYGARFGIGLGANRDFSSVGAIFSRVTASFDAPLWRIGGNLRFEKAFADNRDGIDLVTSIGYQHRIIGPMFGGIEAVGQDLEGFWETDEAEGGAKLLIGPSINVSPTNSRFSFSMSGGPVFYATHSSVTPSAAIRDLGLAASQNGYAIRALVSFNLHK